MSGPRDRLERPLRDLRVSVTDRCNFRCRYCMPREAFGPDHAFVQREELLTYEEIVRVARVATGLGVRKIRITGGEPLVRSDVPELVRLLAGLEGVEDLAMTTNGSLLAPLAGELAGAGLDRVTVSLDALDDETFRAMGDVQLPVERVLEGLAAARGAGLDPVKINAVIKRGVNEHAIDDLTAYAAEHGDIVRFIEYMDVGTTNGWELGEVVPGREILERLREHRAVRPLPARYEGEVADRYRVGEAGEVGVITSVTEPFCATCTRARLSPVGEVFTCLFAAEGFDLRSLLRGGADDEQLRAALGRLWRARTDRYSELRSEATTDLPRVEMSYIGG